MIATIVCGLRAGRTIKEIMSYRNIIEITGGSADTVLTGRKGTMLAANLDELITRDFGR
jgi:hypothetical protein